MATFVNILTKSENQSDFLWVTRTLNFCKAYSAFEQPPVNHQELKESILSSEMLKAVEELVATDSDDPKNVKHEIREILDEVGYKRSVATIRWLAYLVVKILRKTLHGIYVNESALMELRKTMGSCPVVLVPTHRSYGDFILMAFICFVYEIEIPCVAAGLDFLSMWFMGEILRKTKAFFIRRTFQDDKLYKVVFAQYVSTLLSQGNSPLEFFIEGTRSRTGKSLKPKYGFLSMILKPFMEGDVPDIKLVPVSISYDRFLEEWLFTRELLGTPKPKESTKGLLQVFSVLKENYGNVYFNFGEPISVRDWISKEARNRPTEVVKLLAADIIQSHTELQVLGAFHLVMVVLYNNIIAFERSEMSLNSASKNFDYVLSVVHALGLNVLLTKGNACDEITYACKINPELIGLCGDKLRFFGNEGIEDNSLSSKLSTNKGVTLLLYVNPVATVLFCPGLLMMLVAASEFSDLPSDLEGPYNLLCELFEYEFPVACCPKKNNYQKVKLSLLEMKCISSLNRDDRCSLSMNRDLIGLLYSIVHPYIEGYTVISLYLLKSSSDFHTLTSLSKKCEQHLNTLYKDGTLKLPFCATRSFVNGCLSTIVKMKCLLKLENGSIEINPQGISEIANVLNAVNFNPATRYPFKAKL